MLTIQVLETQAGKLLMKSSSERWVGITFTVVAIFLLVSVIALTVVAIAIVCFFLLVDFFFLFNFSS